MKALALALACAATLCTGAAAGPAIDLGSIAGEGWPSRDALGPALAAYDRAVSAGVVTNARVLTLIDYTKPSTEPRLWVLDLVERRVLYREPVAHGKNSGGNMATSFSNDTGSQKSSLGLFVTDHTYYGDNGYSLRLRGLDPGVNDHAYDRAIVVHGAPYVNPLAASKLGRLGRSWGCPALRPEVARAVIDVIKDGSVLFAYGPAARAS